MSSKSDPARGFSAVTTSDTVDLPANVRAIYVGVSGDVSAVPLGGGTAVVFKAAPVGVLPIEVSRINATDTTATDIVALF